MNAAGTNSLLAAGASAAQGMVASAALPELLNELLDEQANLANGPLLPFNPDPDPELVVLKDAIDSFVDAAGSVQEPGRRKDLAKIVGGLTDAKLRAAATKLFEHMGAGAGAASEILPALIPAGVSRSRSLQSGEGEFMQLASPGEAGGSGPHGPTGPAGPAVPVRPGTPVSAAKTFIDTAKAVIQDFFERKQCTREEAIGWLKESDALLQVKQYVFPWVLAARYLHKRNAEGDKGRLEELKKMICVRHGWVKYEMSEIDGIDRDDMALIPLEKARKFSAILIGKAGTMLVAVTSRPHNVACLDDIKATVNKRKGEGYTTVEPLFAFDFEIEEAIERLYGSIAADAAAQELANERAREVERVTVVTPMKEISESDPAIVRIVENIFNTAIRLGASDIHISFGEKRLMVRFRVHGMLRQHYPDDYEKKLSVGGWAVIARVMVLAKLQHDKVKLFAQDGRIEHTPSEGGIGPVDMRVNVSPTARGPKAVIRLNISNEIKELEELGFLKEQFHLLQRMIVAPKGLVVVTGPTGSGKTTTLYSILRRLNKPEISIVTAEQPVEMLIDGIDQVPVSPTMGFEASLRAFLRQDPNIILVGEIRDKETAMTAIEAAETGHLVFSTLHTNDALSTVKRLLNLGIPPYMLTDLLRGVLSQRLARVICGSCRTEIDKPSQYYDDLELTEELLEGRKLCFGKGCKDCGNTGVEDRIGVYEVVPVTEAPDDPVRQYIMEVGNEKDPRAVVQAALEAKGIIFQRRAARLLALNGQISPEEFIRIMGRRLV